MGLTLDNKVLLSVGELNKNKNHEVIIKALSKLNNPNIHYLICGQGNLKGYLEKLIKKLNLENNVKLLGFRKDIYEIYKISDIFVFPSKREGLSVALMEALVCELPVICSDIRGNRDLVRENKNGMLVKNKKNDYEIKIKEIIEKKRIYEKMDFTFTDIDLKKIEKMLCKIYIKNIKEII